MTKLNFPYPGVDIPKVDWDKRVKWARENAIRICKGIEDAHKKAAQSKLVFK